MIRLCISPILYYFSVKRDNSFDKSIVFAIPLVSKHLRLCILHCCAGVEFSVEVFLILIICEAVKIFLQVRVCDSFLKRDMFSYGILLWHFCRDDFEYNAYETVHFIRFKDIFIIFLTQPSVWKLSSWYTLVDKNG